MMNSDLMRLNVDFAVSCLVNETCAANTSNIHVCVFDILDVQALDAERQYNLRVRNILYNHVLLPFVIACRLDYVLITANVFDLQVISSQQTLIDLVCLCLLLGLRLRRLWRLIFFCSSRERELLRGACLLLVFCEGVIKRTHGQDVFAEQTSGNGILVVRDMVSELCEFFKDYVEVETLLLC